MEPEKNLPLDAYSDQELIELMALKGDPDAAHQAFHAFYRRFEKIVHGSISQICMKYPNRDEMIKVIFNNTFYNAYKSAHTFTCEEGKATVEVRNHIIAWLFTIEKNELMGLFNASSAAKKEKEFEVYGAMLKNAAVKHGPETYDEKIFRQALEQIPKERDREIFYLYWLYYTPTESGQAKKLPPEIAEELSVKFNTTRDNIRQIIVRTKRIVFAYIRENYKKVKS